jgi:hypothetical protein
LSKVRTAGAENGVRGARVWARLLGVEKTVVERVEFDEGDAVMVASVRPGALKEGPAWPASGKIVSQISPKRAPERVEAGSSWRGNRL